MTLTAQAITLAIALLTLLVVIALVRRGRLKERYAVIWLVVAVGMIVLVLARPLLDRLSLALGIHDGTTTLFLVAILVVLGVLLQLSLSLSAIEERVRDLAEAVALSDSAEPVEEANER